MAKRFERGVVQVGWEKVAFELFGVDARTEDERARDNARQRPAGNIIVLIPGHGQTAGYPKRMAAAAATLSNSKIVWSIDITPPAGGDPIKVKALVKIVHGQIARLFPDKVREEGVVPLAITLMGWSHGGGEALRAAELDPLLFPQVVGLCPVGMVERELPELLVSFVLEVLRILWAGLRKLDWAYLKDVLVVGGDLFVGLTRDLIRSRSLMRLIDDIRWASRRVIGEHYDYPGEAVIFFGGQDTVIRWQDAFPTCERQDQISSVLDDWRQKSFPRARSLQVGVIEGNHFAPEMDALAFVRPALKLLGQLEGSQN
jgi:pimeloyl-ACP methyl ester carboxylesterase